MNNYVLDIPFELKEWASFNKVKWDNNLKVFSYTGDSLPEIFKPFLPKYFSYSWNKAKENGMFYAEPVLLAPLWKPKKHQEEATIAITNAFKSRYPGFLLADDVGLGKTISAWSFILSQKVIKNVLIVCPVAVMSHWRNTILHLGTGKKEIMIINYESLSKIFIPSKKGLSSTRQKGKQKRISKEFDAPAFDSIIWDESHKCKNSDNAKSLMAEKLRKKSSFDLWLSATAGQNPFELRYLDSVLNIASKTKMLAKESIEEWCKRVGFNVKRGDFGKWIWESNKEDTAKINNWLFSGKVPFGLRRTPVQIAGWKELQRELFPVELTPQEIQSYSDNWKEFRHKEMGDALGKNSKKKESILVKSLRFRQKSSWLRINSTVDLILEYLDKGMQVAVSVAFRETLNQIQELLNKKKINSAIIYGGLNANEKESERLRFQKGDAKVVLFTVEEGISLHEGEYNDAKRVLLIHDIRWSAIQMAQIEGRCHRDGKFAPAIWLYAEDTIEYKIAGIIVNKTKSMKEMMGDDTKLLLEIEELLSSEK